MATDPPNIPCEWDILVGKLLRQACNISPIGCFSEMTIPKWLLEWRDSVVKPRLEWRWHSLRNRLLTKQWETSTWQQVTQKRLQALSLYLDLHVKATVVLTMTINLQACYNISVIIFHWDTELIHIYFLNDSGQHVTQAVIMSELAQGSAINGS